MINNKSSQFEELLISISSINTYKILKLYNSNNEGWTLTHTAHKLHLPISTIQDYLVKLLNVNLIYKKAKLYYISNFGSFFLRELQDFEIFNNFSQIFGTIPAEMIPSHFIHELIPFLADVEIEEGSWHFMTIINELMTQLKNSLNIAENSFELKILGWWNIDFDFHMLKTYFKDIEMNIESMERFFKNSNLNIKIICHRKILDEIKEDKSIIELMNHFNLFKDFRIFNIESFNFTFIKYNQKISLFLIKDNDIDAKHHIFFDNNPGMNHFFENLFNYYWKRSDPIADLLDKL